MKNVRNHSYHQFYPVLAKIRLNRSLLYFVFQQILACCLEKSWCEYCSGQFVLDKREIFEKSDAIETWQSPCACLRSRLSIVQRLSQAAAQTGELSLVTIDTKQVKNCILFKKVIDCFEKVLWISVAYLSSPVATWGGFGGLNPPNTAPSPPNWNTIN